jgi:hypothetical protein
MLVVPFTTRNGSNKHFAKTNTPPACCLQNCPGGPFFLGLAPARNAPTRIGSGQSTNCGSTNATTSRRQLANAFLTSVLPTNARMPPVRRLLAPLNTYFMSMLPTNARRPPVINGFSMRRLHIVNAFSTKRPLIALWPNALLSHDGWWPPKPSSYGFAAAASTSGLPARLRGNNNGRPLLHVCDMSRTAACTQRSRRSSIDRQPQREQRLWQTRPPSNIATRRPHGRKHWPMRPTSNDAKSQPNALWHWRSQYLPRDNVTLCPRHH